MAQSPHVTELLLRWEELRESGADPTPEELCAQHPELLEEVRKGIARLRRINNFLSVSEWQTDATSPTSPQSSHPADSTESDKPAARHIGKPSINFAEFLSPPRGEGEIGRLGQYRVLKELGRGGMGVVLLAEDTQLLRPAALKILLPQFALDPQARERFLREARAAAGIKHDNVVTIFQVGEERGVPFMAMDYLLGTPLDKYLAEKGELTLSQAVRIARETAEGLEAAHARGLIHRDIKPANLWVEAPKGRVKILDFGLARQEREMVQLTMSGVVMGTPSYMSPEQARAEPLDQRTDLFSLGVVLYRLCTGKLPFTGSTAISVLSALARKAPDPVRQINPQVPVELERLIERLLAKERDQRVATATEVVLALDAIGQAIAGGTPLSGFVAAPATTAGTPAAKDVAAQKSPPKRLIVWVALALAAILLLLGGYLLIKM